MLIASNRIPMFETALPPAATPAEAFAADDLRRHLLAMLGRPPLASWRHALPDGARPAVIHINCRTAEREAGLDAARLAPGSESFYLGAANGAYFIIGGGDRGTLYGVYELLDRLGCRWFTPEHARVPACDTIRLPAGPIRGAPAFEYRDLLSWDCSDPLWALRNRLNGEFQRIPAFLGGSITHGAFVHTLFGYVPPARYFAAHPEYYSEIGGVRRHTAAQLCLTHPEVRRLITEAVLKRMRERPEATLFSVSQQDWEGWCTCAACTRAAAADGSQSALFLRLVNAVAEQTVKEFPGNLVTTLAYTYTEAPPRTRIRLHPNVRIQMCPIRTCQIHPFEACGWPHDQAFLANIRGWLKLTDQLYIWHYATDFSHYSLPLPNLRQLHANIRFYSRNGIRGVFVQANGFSELSGLKGYLAARALWNPSVAMESVLDEFLPAVYGGAADAVRAYSDQLEAAARRTTTHHLGCYERPDHPFYTEPMLTRALATLSRGEACATGEANRHVRLLRTGVELALLFRAYAGRPFRREGLLFHNGFTAADRRRFQNAIAVRRQGGELPLRESVPLEESASRMGAWFEKHRLVELRCGGQRLAVLPSVGGRILEWHVDGRQLLTPPDLGNRHLAYPASEGYAEFVISPPYDYRGYGERYAVTSRSAAAATLEAALPDGLHVRRDYELTRDGLRIRSILTNTGTTSQSRQWGSGLHLTLADWTRLTVATAAGSRALSRKPGKPPKKQTLTLTRESRPTGVWQLAFGACALNATFDSESAATLIVERDDACNRLAIDIRTDTVPRAAGSCFVFEQTFRLGSLSNDLP
jgi:hypothetical protein